MHSCYAIPHRLDIMAKLNNTLHIIKPICMSEHASGDEFIHYPLTEAMQL